jgi:putative DNA primase/helicase
LAADSAGAASQTAREEAAEWLRTVLVDGPMSAADVRSQAQAAGLAWATVRRAKERLGIVPQRLSEGAAGAGRWVWALPAEIARCSRPPQDAHLSDVGTLQKIEHLAPVEDDLPAERETVV